MILPFYDIYQTRDGDVECRAMADRHYSRKTKGSALFVGPGRKIVLRNTEGSWVFVWRNALLREDGQTGWECTIFRNESGELSSEIILKCEAYVEGRKFTYVEPSKIKSVNPGYCFKRAGWKQIGHNKDGRLVLLEKD